MIRVRKDNPCPICGRPDWCLIAEDGSVAICQRVESSVRKGDAGWLHKITDVRKYVPKAKPKPKVPVKDFSELAFKYFLNLTQQQCGILEAELGVSVDSLRRCEVGWDGKNYTFPMRSGYDKIIGIQRRPQKGKKFCVTGSNLGLFWPRGVDIDSTGILFIPEGSSDTPTLLDMGFDAIGRPNCSAGTEDVKILLKNRNKRVVIFSDKDEATIRPDGTKFYPGQDGAKRLAKEILPLCRWVKIIKPVKGKDVRAWKQAGATKEMVEAVIKNTRFFKMP